jgi:hypothetical protein
MSLAKESDPEISQSEPWAKDPLSREAEGKILASLISGLGDSPFVISLKGGWGTGKSIFLRRLGYHLELSHKIPVVRIDAWQSDYLDDPLLAMTSALAERLGSAQNVASSAVDSVITGLAGSAGKIALPVLSAIAGLTLPGGSQVVQLASTLPELAQNFLGWDQARKSAEDKFRSSLSQAREKLKSSLDSDESSPIVIVVDELDRCRPDFAIKFLERIKHFFNVQGICFLIAIDHQNLPQAVKTVYGEQVDGELYLRKFFDFEFNLPRPSLKDHAHQIFQKFPGADSAKDASPMRRSLLTLRHPEVYERMLEEGPEELERAEYSIYFGHIATFFEMQLRDSLQAHTLLMAFVRSFPKNSVRFPFIDCYIACLRFAAPTEYMKLIAHSGGGLPDTLRSSNKASLNTIGAIGSFLTIKSDSDASEFRTSTRRWLNNNASRPDINFLAYVSLFVRSLETDARGSYPRMTFNAEDYLESVLRLTSAFTETEEPEDI